MHVMVDEDNSVAIHRTLSASISTLGDVAGEAGRPRY